MFASADARQQFAELAKTYVGTRYRRQGRFPGLGLDCAGVAVCAAQATGFDIEDRFAYGDLPFYEQIVDAFDEHCDRVALDDLEVGDILLMAWVAEPQHVCVVTSVDPYIEITHAHATARKVVRHILSDDQRARVRIAYRLRDQAPAEV